MVKSCKQHSSTLSKILREKKLKATPGRLAILDIFEHIKKPISIKELANNIGLKNIDMATLYRNTETLADLGLLMKIYLDEKKVYYEPASRGHHHHLICEKCGKVEGLKNCVVSNVSYKEIQAKGFSKILRHNLEYFGLCGKCG